MIANALQRPVSHDEPAGADSDGRIDLAEFARAVEALGRRARIEAGADDIAHLRRIERWGRASTVLGWMTAWIIPNPLSAWLLAQGLTVRLLVGHHVGHGAYDRIPDVPARYTRRYFGTGWRRALDWLDWWPLPHWHHLHNNLHHAHTGDPLDPDIVDEDAVREAPRPLRLLLIAIFTITWKFLYYAPHMQREWLSHERGRTRTAPYRYRLGHLFNPLDPDVRRLWLSGYLPYIAVHFLLLPGLVFPLSHWAALSLLLNAVLGELIHNAQGFICIRPSHSAADIPRFAARVRGKVDFFARQVLATVNYCSGGDLRDALHIWTNYQIEHHLWPDLTLLQYQRLQPEVKRLCNRYGLPYRQESVWRRFLKTIEIYMGDATQPRLAAMPAANE